MELEEEGVICSDEEIVIDDEEDDFEELEQESNFPPYWFKSKKQKRKFFNNLNTKFASDLQKNKIHKGNNESQQSPSAIQRPRLTIHTGKTTVKKFDKNQQVNQLAQSDY